MDPLKPHTQQVIEADIARLKRNEDRERAQQIHAPAPCYICRCPRIRSLRTNGGVLAYEWNCAAYQPQPVKLIVSGGSICARRKTRFDVIEPRQVPLLQVVSGGGMGVVYKAEELFRMLEFGSLHGAATVGVKDDGDPEVLSR